MCRAGKGEVGVVVGRGARCLLGSSGAVGGRGACLWTAREQSGGEVHAPGQRGSSPGGSRNEGETARRCRRGHFEGLGTARELSEGSKSRLFRHRSSRRGSNSGLERARSSRKGQKKRRRTAREQSEGGGSCLRDCSGAVGRGTRGLRTAQELSEGDRSCPRTAGEQSAGEGDASGLRASSPGGLVMAQDGLRAIAGPGMAGSGVARLGRPRFPEGSGR